MNLPRKACWYACFSLLLIAFNATAQVQVSTLVQLNASGGVTWGPDGYLYVSDFGPQLGPEDVRTSVYRVDPRNGSYSVFAEGFQGASGAAFDAAGNFFQAEPRGNRITRIGTDGERRVVAEGLSTPIGVQVDTDGTLFVCNCASGEIVRIAPGGMPRVFARDPELMLCPNGLTSDLQGNLYAVTFGAGNLLKITADGEVSLLATFPALTGGPNPVGLGHITFANGKLYVTAIGSGMIYRVALDGSVEQLAGVPFAFTNSDGPASAATFSKPNGIAANPDGTELYVNVSDPPWTTNPTGLHPVSIRKLSGIRP